jgi:Tfp pilus assembly pilus retraction ATPase PilT
VLEGIMCQSLLPKATGDGRVMALEILIPNAAIRNLIREDKIHQIYSMMQTGSGQIRNADLQPGARDNSFTSAR